jgi:uncharacterized membrane protein
MADSAVTTSQPQSGQHAQNAALASGPVNVGDLERWLSVFAGGALALYSLRRSLGNFMLLFGAGSLLYRGLTGHCPLYQTMAISTAHQDGQLERRRAIAGPDDTPRIVIASS